MEENRMVKSRVIAVVLPILAASIVLAAAVVVMVRPVAGEAPCEVPAEYATIQSAVDEPACEVVAVAAGTFYENVTIGRSVTIRGEGQDVTVVDGSQNGRVYDIEPMLAVTITGQTIRNGLAPAGTAYAQGGGVRVFTSTLFLEDVLLTGNQGDLGGGVFASNSTVTVRESNLSGNEASVFGGGLASVSGSSTLIDSTALTGNNGGLFGGGVYGLADVINSSIISNTAEWGGGIYGGVLTVTQSVLAGNSAASSGGAMYVIVGSITTRNVTVSGNSATFYGGGAMLQRSTLSIYNSSFASNTAEMGGGIYLGGQGFTTTLTLANSLVANNVGADCTADAVYPVTSLGYSLDSDGSCGLTGEGDQSNIEPLLGPLQDNGGPTWTHALLPGSPAIDARSPAVPGNGGGACAPTDQRWVVRPQDGDDDGEGRCDIGAFELWLPSSLVFLPVLSGGAAGEG
jgi:hypothetical protein